MNLKGGVGKTLSAVALAHGLAPRGDTLLVDADPQESALRWAGQADFPFSTVAFPTRALARHIRMQPQQHIVVDTPPEDRGVVAAALRSVEIALVPLQPTTADMAQLGETLGLIAEAQELNEGLRTRFLLTRVLKRSRALQMTEQYFRQGEHFLLQAQIPQRQRWALAHGQPLLDLGEYQAVLEELEEEGHAVR